MPFLILDGKSQDRYFAVSGSGTEANPFYLFTTSSGGSAGGGPASQSGNWTVGITGSLPLSPVTGLIGITGNVPVTPVTGTINIGTIPSVNITPMSSGGCSGYTFLSNGSTVSGVVKGSPGQLYGASFGNESGSAVYYKLYNQTTAPGTGATPIYRFLIPGNTAGAGREKIWPQGLQFTVGIAFRATSNSGDTASSAIASHVFTANLDVK